MPKPQKPDNYLRGGVYPVRLPVQPIEEHTDGKDYSRRGNDICDTLNGRGHHCIVVSNNDFNDGGRGLIVVPMTTKAAEQKQEWIRLRFRGEVAYALCDQIRYVDKSRCGPLLGTLFNADGTPTTEFTWVANAIKRILMMS